MMKQPIGEFLATLRRANGFTQQEVADRLGISNRTLSAWERGTAIPDILLLPALADLYGVTVDEILRGERSSAEKPAIAQQSAQKIYKSKAARFSMWAFILSGTALVGLVLFYAGYYTDWNYLTYGNIEQFEWWLILLYLGAILCAVCLIVLFALWKYNDNMLDEDDAAPYRVAMKKMRRGRFHRDGDCLARFFRIPGIKVFGHPERIRFRNINYFPGDNRRSACFRHFAHACRQKAKNSQRLNIKALPK